MKIITHDFEEFDIVGYLGLSLYSAGFLIVFWRTVIVFEGGWMRNTQQIFHLLMTFMMTMEILYYISIVRTGHYTKDGYICNLLGLMADLITFSMVIYRWVKTLGMDVRYSTMRGILYSINVVNFFGTVAVCGTIVKAKSMNHYFRNGDSVIYLVVVGMQAFTLLSLSSFFVFYGLKLQTRLMENPQWAPLALNKRQAILLRVNMTLIVCAVCYLSRAISLVILLNDLTRDTSNISKISIILWFMFSNWVPLLIPSAFLLYVMRNSVGMKGNGGVTAGGTVLNDDEDGRGSTGASTVQDKLMDDSPSSSSQSGSMRISNKDSPVSNTGSYDEPQTGWFRGIFRSAAPPAASKPPPSVQPPSAGRRSAGAATFNSTQSPQVRSRVQQPANTATASPKPRSYNPPKSQPILSSMGEPTKIATRRAEIAEDWEESYKSHGDDYMSK